MISKRVYTKEYITNLREGRKCDPFILERSVFAFGLLEAFARTKAEFIFKGGTSLMLLLDEPIRLSTDIDIIVKSDVDIMTFIKNASKIYPFERFEENPRVGGASKIVKKHFRFYYKSLQSEDKEVPVLLDVLFEDNHYAEVIQKEIKNSLLITEGEPIFVTIPSVNSILGDKLTAFAPHTIGIKPNYEKENGEIVDKKIEVMKQFFDVATLFDYATDMKLIATTYKNTANTELKYLGLNQGYEECLMDSFNEALSILSRGYFNSDYFKKYYLPGIRGLKQYLINVRFTSETAYVQAAKIMYLSALIITGVDRPKDLPVADNFKNEYSKINYIRRLNRDAFNMAAYAIKLIEEKKTNFLPKNQI